MIEEQLMSKNSSGRKRQPRERPFISCVREFLSPSFFRQVYRTLPRGRKRRWEIQPLLYVLLCMTWCLGDSQPERFETARAFCVASHPKRRRPGKTFQGFQKALEALPCSVFRTVARLFRQQILARFGSLMRTDGWLVFGCDGSRIRTPRTGELERRLGDSGMDSNSKCKTPQVWLTALVHLQSGMPWSWRVGKGDASERNHLIHLIATLPLCALVVTDAGYQSYLLAWELVGTGNSFLMRASTQTIFYVADAADMAVEGEYEQVTAEALDQWAEGEVYYWPREAQTSAGRQKPIKVRLIRIKARKKKNDVWLVTDVLDRKRLTAETTGKYYRMRWAALCANDLSIQLL
jgi:Transposase DDE domain